MSRTDRPVAARAAANAALNSGAQVVGKLATLTWTLVAARELGTSAFGAFFYVLAVAQLASAVVEWGFDPVLVRRGARQPELLPSLLTQNLVWQTAVAVPVLGALGVVLVAVRPADERLLVVALLVAVALDGVSDTCRAVGEAAQRQAGVSAAVTLQRVLTAAVAVTVLLLGGGVGGLAASVLAGSVVGTAVHLAAVRRLGVRLVGSAVRPSALRGYVRGTLFIGMSTLVLMALFRVDTVLLGVLRDEEEVAAYSAAYRFLETALFVSFAIASVVFPIMSAASERGVVQRALTAGLSAGAVVYVPLAVVLALEPGPLLGLLFGDPFSTTSDDPLRLLALAPLCYLAAYLSQSGLQAVDRAVGMLVAASTALTVNVVLDVLLIPAYGASAAAAVTTLSYALHAAVMLLWLRRAGVRPQLLRPLREPAAASVPLAVVLLVLDRPVLLELVAGGALYAAAWLLLVRRTAPEQLGVLRGLLRRR
ncbi:MAG TPA: oligosaccharide flippase family protein [Mycobacteriales bacterium]|nr:oligosaccharide flippase family protein [Mycobacteriales bacterium]